MTTELTPLQQRWLLPDHVDGVWAARRRLAEAVRELALATVTTGGDVAALDAVTAQVRALTPTLPPGPTAAQAWDDGSYFDTVATWVDRGAMLGRSNPLAPPLYTTWDGARSVCDVVLTETYRGAPGMVHGGVVAAVFDQVFGHCVVMSGSSGLTGTLTVRYRRPTRLGVPLRFAAWRTTSEGRRLTLEATCTDDGHVTAEASALFVALDEDGARRVIGGARANAPASTSASAASAPNPPSDADGDR
ncbi:MAG: PaaI family thioesterase [Alphaproteobacteria bacterium]|nr:PaaI family thioesterase [Alphaproteobacteria bacterium]